jgi:hypothetical protein
MGCGASSAAAAGSGSGGAGTRAPTVDRGAAAAPSASAPAALGPRLLELGRTASLELSPAQAHSPKLKYTLCGAIDAAASAAAAAVAVPEAFVPCPHCKRSFAPTAAARHVPACASAATRPKPPPEIPDPPLPAGCRCFVNMVKKSLDHFDEVAAACAALQQRGLVAVPHLPASRFDSSAELERTLGSLAAAGCSRSDYRSAGPCLHLHSCCSGRLARVFPPSASMRSARCDIV